MIGFQEFYVATIIAMMSLAVLFIGLSIFTGARKSEDKEVDIHIYVHHPDYEYDIAEAETRLADIMKAEKPKRGEKPKRRINSVNHLRK